MLYPMLSVSETVFCVCQLCVPCPFQYYAKRSGKDFKGVDTTKSAIESSKKSKGGRQRFLVLSEKDVKILKRDAKVTKKRSVATRKRAFSAAFMRASKRPLKAFFVILSGNEEGIEASKFSVSFPSTAKMKKCNT